MTIKSEFAGTIAGLALDAEHRFSKLAVGELEIIAGLGVAGDAHAGEKVQHRSRVAVNPDQPNLRQVHLIHTELFDALGEAGFELAPGQLGENIATAGIDLLALPRATILHIGESAMLEVTGLRNPCAQIEAFRPGLLNQVARRGEDGSIERLAGIMCIVLASGTVRQGDPVRATLPKPPHQRLQPV